MQQKLRSTGDSHGAAGRLHRIAEVAESAGLLYFAGGLTTVVAKLGTDKGFIRPDGAVELIAACVFNGVGQALVNRRGQDFPRGLVFRHLSVADEGHADRLGSLMQQGAVGVRLIGRRFVFQRRNGLPPEGEQALPVSAFFRLSQIGAEGEQGAAHIVVHLNLGV